MRLPRVRFTIRRMMIIVALAALVFAYAGSYYRLSRRGMREAAMYNVSGFLYVQMFHRTRMMTPNHPHRRCSGLAREMRYLPKEPLDLLNLRGRSNTVC
jgi:hypothetical protein